MKMKKPTSSPQSPGKDTEERKIKKEEKKEEKVGDEDDSDRDVVKRLMDRLLTLQKKVDQQQMDLWSKDRYTKRLQDNLQILITARGGNTDPAEGDETQQRVKKLEHQCLLLQKQVHQMESFLADYGMVWVGETPDLETDRDSLSLEMFLEEVRDRETPAAPFHIDFDLLMENLQYLNTIAGDGETSLQPTTTGARLTRQLPLDVTFFANGLVLAGGPFRPYADPAARQCLQDFLDCYFPTELQARYPEGVPFSVVDRREVVFPSDRDGAVFPGVGQMLGVSPEHAQLSAAEETHVADKETQAATPPPKAAQATSPATPPPKAAQATSPATPPPKAAQASSPATPPPKPAQATSPATPPPKAAEATSAATPPPEPAQATSPATPPPKAAEATSAGTFSRQVEVLADLSTPSAFGIIEETQRDDGQSPTGESGRVPSEEVVIETKARKALPGEEDSRKNGASPQSTCTLRVKSESGNLTYLLHMRSADTIGDLRHCLDTHRTKHNLSTDYLICSAYPRQVYSDGEASLESCGLFPNGVLYLQARAST